MRFRIKGVRLAVVFVAAIVAALAATAPASAVEIEPAGFGFNPMETNYPYIGWSGQKLRLVKCSPLIATGTSISWVVESWSGDHSGEPELVSGTSGFVTPDDAAGPGPGSLVRCAKGAFVSVKDGIARIKLVVTNAAGEELVDHQFLVIWLDLLPPIIRECNVGGDITTGGAGDICRAGGTQPGTGIFQPGGTAGHVQVLVKGSADTSQDGGAVFGVGPDLVLPDEFVALANSSASVSAGLLDAFPGSDPSDFWDVHDVGDPLDPQPALAYDSDNPAPCRPLSATGIDRVTNCPDSGTNEIGRFSTIFGPNVGPTVGPFDPVYPRQTLLSDGQLLMSDAMMPSTRVDFTLSGAFGNLTQVDKGELYKLSLPHGYDSPFNQAYIPATSRAAAASGPEGTTTLAGQNNFPGYLLNGIYNYWDHLATPGSAGLLGPRALLPQDINPGVAGTQECLLVDRNQNGLFDAGDVAVRAPSGLQRVSVYTDEHGEARMGLTPPALNPQTGIIGIGLAGATFQPSQGCIPSGTAPATITAQVRYPFQPPQAVTPGPVTIDKQLNFNLAKSVQCHPKPSSTGGIVTSPTLPEVVCVAIIAGTVVPLSAFDGEPIVFTAPDSVVVSGFAGAVGPPGAQLFPNTPNLADRDGPTSGTVLIAAPSAGSNRLAAAVINGGSNPFTVKVFFRWEGLTIDVCVSVGPGGTVTTTPGVCPIQSVIIQQPPTTTGGTGGTTTPSTTQPTTTTTQTQQPTTTTTQTQQPATVVSLQGQQIAPAAAAKATLASARLITIKGQRFLMVRVNSVSPTARVKITLVNRVAGKTKLVSVFRTVATNKLARVPNLTVTKKTKSVKVALALTA